MKSGRIFWGTLFVVLGGLVLLNNFITIDLPWEHIWRFWPVILILIGVSALSKDKQYRWMLNAGIALIAGFLLFASVQNGCTRVKGVFQSNGEVFTNSLHAPADSSIQTATLHIDGGAGVYRIQDTTSEMLLARTRTTFGYYTLLNRSENGAADIEIALNEKHIRWQGGKFKNSVKVSLSPLPEWNLDLNVGAAAVDLDLTPYRIRKINMDAGAASIDMRLGIPETETRVAIDAGASSISILVPEGAGCEITSDAELSSHDFIGFMKVSEKVYRTDGFDASMNKIFIEIDGGISSIEVRRYKPGTIQPMPGDEHTTEDLDDTLMF